MSLLLKLILFPMRLVFFLVTLPTKLIMLGTIAGMIMAILAIVWLLVQIGVIGS